jgi:hypothetical protein
MSSAGRVSMLALAAASMVASFGSGGCSKSAPASSRARAAASSGQETEPERRPEPIDPYDHLPADSQVIVHVDVRRLRDSPYGPTLERTLLRLAERELTPELAEVLEAHIARLDELWLSGRDAGRGRVFVRGEFSGDMAADWVRWPGDEVARKEKNGRVLYEGEQLATTRVRDRLWLVANADRLGAMVAGLDTVEDGALQAGRLAAVAGEIEFRDATAAVVFEIDEEAERRMSRAVELSVGGIAGARLDADDGVQLAARLHAPDDASAAETHRAATRMLDRFGGHPLVRVLGLDPIFTATLVEVEGRTVELETVLDDPTARDLLAKLARLAGTESAEAGPSEPSGRRAAPPDDGTAATR